MQVKERVFVLKSHKFGEADLIVHTLNSQGSRIQLFAKSALKSKKRFGPGVFEPTHYIEVVYQKRKSESFESPLFHVQESRLIKDFSGLRSDYDKLDLALHIIKLIEKISKEGDENSRALFDLLGNALQCLEISKDLENFKILVELKLLYTQGILSVDALIAKCLNKNISQHHELDLSESEKKQLKILIQNIWREYLPALQNFT